MLGTRRRVQDAIKNRPNQQQAERFKKTDSRKQQHRGSKLPPVWGYVANKAGQLPHVAPSLHCRTRLAADEISIDGRTYSTLVDLSGGCCPLNDLLETISGYPDAPPLPGNLTSAAVC